MLVLPGVQLIASGHLKLIPSLLICSGPDARMLDLGNLFLQEQVAGPFGRERKCLRSTVLTFHQKLRLSPICVSVPSWPVPPQDHSPHCQWKLPLHTLEWGCVSHCPGAGIALAVAQASGAGVAGLGSEKHLSLGQRKKFKRYLVMD